MINISYLDYILLTNEFYNNTLLKAVIEALYNNRTVVMLEDVKTKYFFKINDFDSKCDKFEFKLYLTSKNNERGELFIYERGDNTICVLDYKGKRTLLTSIIATKSFDDILEYMLWV